MATIDIIVPEDQAEGTKFALRSWLKPAGSTVAKDDAIAEIETDKVTMEVVAPEAGVLETLLVQAGAELQPGMKIARLTSGASAAQPAPSTPQAVAKAPEAKTAGPRNTRLSPLVRRLLAQNNVDADAVTGTGRDGRITPADVQAFAGSKGAAPSAPAVKSSPTKGGRKIPHTAMRRSIAEHMSRSVTVAPHVTAVFEADFGTIIKDRAQRKRDAKKPADVPTYTAYVVAACVQALRAVPQVNSRWHDDAIEIFDDINIGFGVSLGDGGLIVPVIHKAQDLSLMGIAQRLDDLTNRARAGKLQAADMQGGTFTISNHGVSGSLLATPIIINQPQSAILGVGKLEKRVVVREVNGTDAIVIAQMAYVSLTIDHRVLDGHQTNAFLTKWVEVLENWR